MATIGCIQSQDGKHTILLGENPDTFLRWEASGRSGYGWSGRTERSWRKLRDNISKYIKIINLASCETILFLMEK